MEQISADVIAQGKTELRRIFREKRRLMDIHEKDKLDALIFDNFISCSDYAGCDTIFAYVSTASEVDTYGIIHHALAHGKRVAVPLCYPETKGMEYYYIRSEDDLKAGHYGIMEPDISVCEKADDNTHALCIVPGLCFDKDGYRLGYGGGYYDRYLSAHDIIRIGLCYSDNTVDELIRDRYDVCVDKVITEKTIERNEFVE